MPHPLLQLRQTAGPDPSGRELRAEIRATLIGLAHLRNELVDRVLVQDPGLDHHPLVAQRPAVGGHRPGGRAADVGVMGAVRRERDQLVSGEDGRDHRDVGKVGPSAVGVVEDPGAAGSVVLIHDRRHRSGHRAEVYGDVLGLHHHLAARVKQRRRRVAPLLDVGRVRRADQHGSHLLADRPQRAGQDLELHRVDHRSRLRLIVPV